MTTLKKGHFATMCTACITVHLLSPQNNSHNCCPVKPLFGLDHRAAAQFQGLGNLLIAYAVFRALVEQRFSIPVLAPPPFCIFCMLLLSLQMFVLFELSALRSGHHRIFHHDSSSKRTYIFHSKCIEVCKTWIKIVYIYRCIWCHTRPCVKMLRSANPWMNVLK